MNRHTLKKWTANGTRWLHIYLSMASFAIVFFFAITGITLNHPDRFGGEQKTSQAKGQMDKAWMSAPAAHRSSIVDSLRRTHGVRGANTDFRVEDNQCTVSFKGPGYTADAFIDRASGAYELTITSMGWIAVWNDLHKGRDTGPVWAWVIDLSAVLLVLVSVTGAGLLWFVHKRRVSGYFAAIAGTIASWVLYRLFVP